MIYVDKILRLKQPVSEPTPEQLHILRHALGLDENGRGRMYRNHYCAHSDADCWNDLQELIRLGLMQDYGKIEIWGGAHGFTVTDEGKALATAGVVAEKLTRSQARYRRFLEADCGMPFGEWLKAWAKVGH